jgi:hypothetical protein
MTDLEVANLALSALGMDPIRSLTDPTKTARFVNSYLVPARNSVLRSYPWRSVRKRARLSSIAWTALAAHAVGDFIMVGSNYYIATAAGTSAGTIPAAWPTTGNITDGSVTWTYSPDNLQGSAYQYALPADCLAPQRLEDNSSYSLEGGILYTDDEPDALYGNPVLVYTKKPADSSSLPDDLAMAVSYHLAVLLLPYVGGNAQTLPLISSQYELARQRAIANEARGASAAEADAQKWTEV